MARKSQAGAPQFLLLGEILRPHGVRGELRLRLLTDYPERINELAQVFIGRGPEDDRARPYPVQHMRMNQEYGLLKLKQINDRDEAEQLRRLFVMVRLEDAVPLEDDELYLFQLIGMQVQTEAGEALGQITDVLETGANDVYIIASPRYGEILFPVTEETVLNTDVEGGVITVRVPDGLLPEG